MVMKVDEKRLTALLCAGQIFFMVDGLFIPGTLMFEGWAWTKKNPFPHPIPLPLIFIWLLGVCVCAYSMCACVRVQCVSVCARMYVLSCARRQVLLSGRLPWRVEVRVTWHPCPVQPTLPTNTPLQPPTHPSMAPFFISTTSPSSLSLLFHPFIPPPLSFAPFTFVWFLGDVVGRAELCHSYRQMPRSQG